jgi:hypothetical protein
MSSEHLIDVNYFCWSANLIVVDHAVAHTLGALSARLIERPQEPAGPRESFRVATLSRLDKPAARLRSENEVRARRSWTGNDNVKVVGPLDPDAFSLANEQPG